MTRSEAKRIALSNLKGRWGYALISLLIFAILTSVGSFAYLIILFSTSLTIGISSIFIGISKKDQNDYGRLFDGFKDGAVGQRIILSILKSIFIALWTLLFVIPGIVKTYSYGLAELISYRHPEYTWKECLQESEKRMKGHKMQLFIFDLSYILWYVLAMCTCGLLLLYVTPYYNAARIEYIHHNIYSLYSTGSSDKAYETVMDEVFTRPETKDSSSVIDEHNPLGGQSTETPRKVTKDSTLSEKIFGEQETKDEPNSKS